MYVYMCIHVDVYMYKYIYIHVYMYIYGWNVYYYGGLHFLVPINAKVLQGTFKILVTGGGCC